MPVLSLADAAALLPPRGVLIGLDLGSKTIGVAASDPDRRVAAGVETIARQRFALDARRILDLAAERRATGVVLGLPINMDGSEGPRAQSTRAFARNLSGLTALAIGLWDERLSTAAVERELIGIALAREFGGECRFALHVGATDRGIDLVRQAAAVGVAQADQVCPGCVDRLEFDQLTLSGRRHEDRTCLHDVGHVGAACP